MIHKLLNIRNLGRLRHLTWGRGIGEAPQTVGVFAENGAGKTTLVAALRALRDRADTPLLERSTLPDRAAPLVELLTSAGIIRYNGTVWSGAVLPIEIFDRAFIDDNVYDGREAGPSQRHRLYRLALGTAEVAAARRAEEAKQRLRRDSDLRKPIVSRLQQRAGELGETITSLKALEPLLETPAELVDLEARLRAMSGQTDVTTLSRIAALPDIPPIRPDGLRAMLDETVASLSSEAVAAVQAHVATHLDAKGEAWLLQGALYCGPRDECPFCGQNLSTSSIAAIFPRFFDQAYQRLRERIEKGIARLEVWKQWVVSLNSVERLNQKSLAVWRPLVWIAEPPDIAGLGEAADSIVAILRALLEDKRARPLDSFGSDIRVFEISTRHEAISRILALYSEWARQSDEACQRLAADVIGERQRLRETIRKTRARVLRGSASISSDFEALATVETSIAAATADRDAAQAELEQLERARTTVFVDSINAVLTDFGAGFRLRELQAKASSVRITADFKIALIDGGEIQVSSKRSREPRFDTVLSEGDRTTLALAVFFARCIDRPDPSRVIVLDDPLCSLDRARRGMTMRYIAHLMRSNAQVWVLSHDEFFLRDSLPTNAMQLRLRHESGHTTVESWDLHAHCLSTYARNVARLELFIRQPGTIGTPSPDDAWRMIRPILEEYLRFRFQRAWNAGEWLADFIQKGRTGNPHVKLTITEIDRLAAWCRISNPGMHGDPHDAGPVPSIEELRIIAEQVLEFVHS